MSSGSEKVLKWLIKLFGIERHHFTVARNIEYEETDAV